MASKTSPQYTVGPSQRASLAMEMECCAVDLSVVLRAAKARGEALPETETRALLRQLLAAIAACHAVGAETPTSCGLQQPLASSYQNALDQCAPGAQDGY